MLKTRQHPIFRVYTLLVLSVVISSFFATGVTLILHMNLGPPYLRYTVLMCLTMSITLYVAMALRLSPCQIDQQRIGIQRAFSLVLRFTFGKIIVVLMLNIGSIVLCNFHVERELQPYMIISLTTLWYSAVFPIFYGTTKRLYREMTDEGKKRSRKRQQQMKEWIRLWLQGFPPCFFVGFSSILMMILRTWSSTHWYWIIAGGWAVKSTLQFMLRVAASRFHLTPNFVQTTFIVIGIGMDAQVRMAVMDVDVQGDMTLEHVWTGSLIVMALEFLSRVFSAGWFTRLLQRQEAPPKALEKLHWVHSAGLFGNMMGEYGAIMGSILIQQAQGDNLAQLVYSALIQIGAEFGIDALSMLIEHRLGIRIDAFLQDRIAIGIAINTITACTCAMVITGVFLFIEP